MDYFTYIFCALHIIVSIITIGEQLYVWPFRKPFINMTFKAIGFVQFFIDLKKCVSIFAVCLSVVNSCSRHNSA